MNSSPTVVAFFLRTGHHLDHSVGSSTMERSCPALETKSVWKTWRKTWCIYLDSRCLNIPMANWWYIYIYCKWWLMMMIIIWLMMVNNYLVGGIPTPLKKMMQWVTVGMMKFPINMESHSKVHGSSHHQPGTLPFLHHLAPKKNHRRFRIWIWYIMGIMRR